MIRKKYDIIKKKRKGYFPLCVITRGDEYKNHSLLFYYFFREMEELKAVLELVDGKEPTTKFTKELDEAVKRIKNNEDWRRQYMTLAMRDEEMRQEGMQKGELTANIKLIRKNMSLKDFWNEQFGNDFVETVISLIEVHPDWTNEEIASEILKNDN